MPLLCECHAYVDDLQAWLNVLRDRREALVHRMAKTEFELSILAVVRRGLPGAFIRLRLHIELTCIRRLWLRQLSRSGGLAWRNPRYKLDSATR